MSPNTRRLLVIAGGGLAVLWLVLLGALYLLRRSAHSPGIGAISTGSTHSPDGQPIRYWEVPAFACTDQHGRAVTEQTLRGRAYVSNFIFTRCTTACPLLTAKMALLWRSIDAPGVGFVSFSVDPEYDTPAVLAEYAASWNGDPRWLLLRMDPARLPDFARAMNSPLQRQPDPVNPILHSSYFFLVDDAGWVRGVYDSIDEEAMQRLVVDARALAAAAGLPTSPAPPAMTMANSPEQATPTPAPPADTATAAAERGGRLFEAVGCAACHDNPRLGPTLAGLFGRPVQLEGGAVAPADSTYLRTSILEPGAQTVGGYGTVMPSYRRHLSPAEVSDLLAYVAALPPSKAAPRRAAQATPAPARPTTVVDPVCKMDVTAGPDAPRSDYGGQTYFFCSELCRERFVKDPAAYLLPR